MNFKNSSSIIIGDSLVQTNLVVDVTVGEHGVEVLHGLAGAPVIVVLQAFLDGSHVHGVLDHLVVVLHTRMRLVGGSSAAVWL